MNRGRAEVGALVAACRAAGVTDLLVLHETRGRPGQCCPFWGGDLLFLGVGLIHTGGVVCWRGVS